MRLRKPIVAGNWKMNRALGEATELASTIGRELADRREVDIVLCPPFTALKAVSDVISDGYIKLGAQNMHWEKDGAFTGEISAAMLRDIYCRYVILGHSERRAMFHESDEIVQRKVATALDSSLEPIVCVGETLEQREADETESVIAAQLRGSLAGLGDRVAKLIIAYEPVWAIGTGKTATPEQAQEVHAFIRAQLAELSDDKTAQGVRIQYGGSVKPDNVRALISQPDIDGALVGGASLEARSFVELVKGVIDHVT